jgi:hypothetical protein
MSASGFVPGVAVQSWLRYSVYLLYWYKSTNTDATRLQYRWTLCLGRPDTRNHLHACLARAHADVSASGARAREPARRLVSVLRRV